LEYTISRWKLLQAVKKLHEHFIAISLDLKRWRNPNSCALAAVFGSPVGLSRSTSVSRKTLNHGAKDIQRLKYITLFPVRHGALRALGNR